VTNADASQKSVATTHDKKPFIVHCGHCNDEWAPAYLPMELGKLSALLKRASCPIDSLRK
jgi:hypothetical protein